MIFITTAKSGLGSEQIRRAVNLVTRCTESLQSHGIETFVPWQVGRLDAVLHKKLPLDADLLMVRECKLFALFATGQSEDAAAMMGAARALEIPTLVLYNPEVYTPSNNILSFADRSIVYAHEGDVVGRFEKFVMNFLKINE